MARLRPHLPFVPDETHTSWAVRLAAFHTGRSLNAFLGDIGVPLVPFLTGVRDAIVRLCDLAGQDACPVLHNTVTHDGARRRLRGEPVAEHFLAKPLRFCPSCLLEDGRQGRRSAIFRRHRLHWTLAPVRTCSMHGVLLSERKREHGARAYVDLDLLMSENDDALRDLVRTGCTQVPTDLEQYVVRRLEGVPGPMWLDRQALDRAWKGTEMLGASLLQASHRRTRTMSSSDWQQAARTGWDAVKDGAGGVAKAVVTLIDRSEHPAAQVYRSLPDSLGALHRWMQTAEGVDVPQEWIDVVVRTVRDRYPIRPGASILGEIVHRPRRTSIGDLCLGVPDCVGRLESGLLSRGMLREDQKGLHPTLQVVDYDRAVAVREALLQAVPLSVVSRLLRLSVLSIEALLQAGFIAHATVNGMPADPYRLDASGLNALRVLLASLPYTGERNATFMTAKWVMKETGKMLPRVLSVSLGGCGQSRARRRKAGMVDTILVSRDDLEEIASSDDLGMSVEVACHMLELPPGYCRAPDVWPDGPFQHAIASEPGTGWISSDEMARFRSTWVLGHRLPTEFGVPASVVDRVIAEQGVEPAVDPNSFGTILYRRADLHGLRFD